MKQIVLVQLGGLRKRLEERKITVEITDASLAHLVHTGYDPTYGARPLKRAIQREIETPLAKLIIGGKVRDGEKIFIDLDEGKGELTFRSEAVTA